MNYIVTTYHQAIYSAGPIDNHYMEVLDIYFPTDLYIDMYTIYVYTWIFQIWFATQL